MNDNNLLSVSIHAEAKSYFAMFSNRLQLESAGSCLIPRKSSIAPVGLFMISMLQNWV